MKLNAAIFSVERELLSSRRAAVNVHTALLKAVSQHHILRPIGQVERRARALRLSSRLFRASKLNDPADQRPEGRAAQNFLASKSGKSSPIFNDTVMLQRPSGDPCSCALPDPSSNNGWRRHVCRSLRHHASQPPPTTMIFSSPSPSICHARHPCYMQPIH